MIFAGLELLAAHFEDSMEYKSSSNVHIYLPVAIH